MSNREEDFNQVVRNALLEHGELAKLKSALRLNILKLITDNKNGVDKSPMATIKIGAKCQTRTIAQLNELIMEYFQWFGYQYSAEIFATEANVTSPSFVPDGAAAANGQNKIPQLLTIVMEHIVEKKSTIDA